MRQYKPMLAGTAEATFNSDEWIFEIKWDGIRAISYANKELSIRSRNQKELIDNFPELIELKGLTRDAVLDGEIIVLKEGKPDFQTVIQRMQNTRSSDIEYLAAKLPAIYVIFDILKKDGKALVDVPLIERKRILKESVKEGKFVVLSLFVEGTGEAYYWAAIEKGLEGIMAKKKQSSYEEGKRSNDWLKIKQEKTCDCVIFGYTKGEGIREKTFGSLILGLYDAARPVFIGKVGTGLTDEELEDLKYLMDKYKVKGETLAGVDMEREVTWSRPDLVCEVGYHSLTNDGKLRIPVFKRLREDKNPLECTIDQIRSAHSE